jgi:hypothetical protein
MTQQSAHDLEHMCNGYYGANNPTLKPKLSDKTHYMCIQQPQADHGENNVHLHSALCSIVPGSLIAL